MHPCPCPFAMGNEDERCVCKRQLKWDKSMSPFGLNQQWFKANRQVKNKYSLSLPFNQSTYKTHGVNPTTSSRLLYPYPYLSKLSFAEVIMLDNMATDTIQFFRCSQNKQQRQLYDLEYSVRPLVIHTYNQRNQSKKAIGEKGQGHA